MEVKDFIEIHGGGGGEPYRDHTMRGTCDACYLQQTPNAPLTDQTPNLALRHLLCSRTASMLSKYLLIRKIIVLIVKYTVLQMNMKTTD